MIINSCYASHPVQGNKTGRRRGLMQTIRYIFLPVLPTLFVLFCEGRVRLLGYIIWSKYVNT